MACRRCGETMGWCDLPACPRRVTREPRDLFGQAPKQAITNRTGEPRGYAAMPGTGPQGETCKTCRHYAIRQRASAYRKCLLMRAVWTGGTGTDIKAGSPACSKWERPE